LTIRTFVRWQVVSNRLGSSRRPAYAIGVGVKPTEISRFARRGVRVINLPGRASRYTEILAAAFTELAEHWRGNVIQSSQVNDEQPLQELSLPPEASGRLCFFAVPLTLLSFYRDRVFPIARDHGFVPMSADDVVSPGDTVNAKIEALIARAQLFVVDTSTANTVLELGMVRRVDTDWSRILVIAPAGESMPSDLRGVLTLTRPDIGAGDEANDFLRRVTEWFARAAEIYLPTLIEEPRRLLQAREYRAAVIAAISLLEVFLKNRLDVPTSFSGRRVTVTSLLEEAHRQERLRNIPLQRVTGWLRTRNQAVHSQMPVSRAVAEQIVRGVQQIVQTKP
jgi:hypothetical protein